MCSKMYFGLHVIYSLCVLDFNEKFEFVEGFSKDTQISDSIELLPEGAELYHAERRTDRYDDSKSRLSKCRE